MKIFFTNIAFITFLDFFTLSFYNKTNNVSIMMSAFFYLQLTFSTFFNNHMKLYYCLIISSFESFKWEFKLTPQSFLPVLPRENSYQDSSKLKKFKSFFFQISRISNYIFLFIFGLDLHLVIISVGSW